MRGGGSAVSNKVQKICSKMQLNSNHKTQHNKCNSTKLNIIHAPQQSTEVREAPDKKMPGLSGHCPNEGGGLDPCPNGLGHLF